MQLLKFENSLYKTTSLALQSSVQSEKLRCIRSLPPPTAFPPWALAPSPSPFCPFQLQGRLSLTDSRHIHPACLYLNLLHFRLVFKLKPLNFFIPCTCCLFFYSSQTSWSGSAKNFLTTCLPASLKNTTWNLLSWKKPLRYAQNITCNLIPWNKFSIHQHSNIFL